MSASVFSVPSDPVASAIFHPSPLFSLFRQTTTPENFTARARIRAIYSDIQAAPRARLLNVGLGVLGQIPNLVCPDSWNSWVAPLRAVGDDQHSACLH